TWTGSNTSGGLDLRRARSCREHPNDPAPRALLRRPRSVPAYSQEYTKRRAIPGPRHRPARRSQRFRATLLQRDGHDRLLGIMLHQQGRRTARIFHRGLELLDTRGGLAIDAQDHIALADTGLGRGSIDINHDDAAARLELGLLLSRQRTHRQADAVDDRRFALGTAAAAAIARHLSLLLELLDRDADALDSLVAPELQLRCLAGLDLGNQRRQLIGGIDRLAINAQDDVERLDAGLVRRTAGFDRGHRRAARPIEAEVLSGRGRDFLDRHTDAPAAHMAVLDELLGDVVGHADRYRERDAFVAAGAAVDLRIDADHFALEIEQRSTGIAWIDRDIGLDERHVAVAAFADVAARRGAHDTGGHAVLEAERRADCEHPLARPQLA